mgnify:FL=1
MKFAYWTVCTCSCKLANITIIQFDQLILDHAIKTRGIAVLQTMLNDKLRETDWEITDEAINEQVARESYLQWLQDCQKQKQRRTPVCIYWQIC